MSQLWQLDTRYACGGLIADGLGVVIETAPIFRWAVGKLISEIPGKLELAGDLSQGEDSMARGYFQDVVKLKSGERGGKPWTMWKVNIKSSSTGDVSGYTFFTPPVKIYNELKELAKGADIELELNDRDNVVSVAVLNSGGGAPAAARPQTQAQLPASTTGQAAVPATVEVAAPSSYDRMAIPSTALDLAMEFLKTLIQHGVGLKKGETLESLRATLFEIAAEAKEFLENRHDKSIQVNTTALREPGDDTEPPAGYTQDDDVPF